MKQNKLYKMVNWLNDNKMPFTRLNLMHIVDGGPSNLVLALEHYGYAEKIPGKYGWYKMVQPITYEIASKCLSNYKIRQTKLNISTAMPIGNVQYEITKTIDQLLIENQKLTTELNNLKKEHDNLIDQYTDLYHDYHYNHSPEQNWFETQIASIRIFFQKLFV